MTKEHDYTSQVYKYPPHKRPTDTKKVNTIMAIKTNLALEAEKVHYSDLFSRLLIDVDSIQSFNEYARYLDHVNPICSRDAVDTPEKLVHLLGI